MANTFRNDKPRDFLRISVIPRRVAFGSIWRYFIDIYFLDFDTVRIIFERRTSKRGREEEEVTRPKNSFSRYWKRLNDHVSTGLDKFLGIHR